MPLTEDPPRTLNSESISSVTDSVPCTVGVSFRVRPRSSKVNAYTHDGAGQSRNAQRGPGEKQKEDNAAKRGGERRDDDERIQPRLEVHHDQHVQSGER